MTTIRSTVKGNIFIRSTEGTIREEAESGQFYVFAKQGIEVESATDGVYVIAAKEIRLTCGSAASILSMKSDGTIVLEGVDVQVRGERRRRSASAAKTWRATPRRRSCPGRPSRRRRGMPKSPGPW